MALMQSNKAGPSKSPLSRSSHGRFEYDVFLSFRGEDTRNNFTGLLRDMLYLKCIRPFFDEDDLHKGERIEEILVAISRSKVFVPIFSKSYADSKWCMREVAKMVEYRQHGGQERLIIPVFFDVDPKHVRHQSGPFQDAFEKHLTDNSREVEGWKQALEYVGGISGFHLKNGNQRELMSSITAEIQKVLPIKKLRYEGGYHVGLEIRVEKMMKCLDFQANHVRLIGIHGIGGIGKTTLANAIYNRSHRFFEACSFVENVREISKSPQGLVLLQQQLIGDITNGQRNDVINNPSEGTQMIIDMVGIKSVLLVLDDVDDPKVLEALAAGKISWFQSGSRIIITTRQKEILEFLGLQGDAVYMLEELDEEESLQLFNYHAFGGEETQEDYIKLSKEVIPITNGVPLVLETFGSLFKEEKTPEKWKKLLEELGRRQVREVHEKLKICYDRLNDNEKQIFLDIACLLVRKNQEDAVYMWENFRNLTPNQAIRSLHNRSLIEINKGKFEMHDQLRDMGREIVMRESLFQSQNRSRLWCEGDVGDAMEALTESQENKIQGILFSLSEENKLVLSTKAFGLMSKLRILVLNFPIYGNFSDFPASLKWLEWKDCPLETLPLESKFKSIVVLNLSGSFIKQLWRRTTTGSSSKSTKESFDALKVLDLSSCHYLTTTFDFLMAPNLEKLILDQCSKLKEVDDSIGSLKKLLILTMRGCVSLEKLPNEIYGLSSLVVFNLEECSNLVAFPQFPPTNSTTGFSKLEQLILRDCQSLEVLPDLHKFRSLRSLHIDGCQRLDHRTKQLFEDVVFTEWDELGVSGSQTLSYEQEFCFLLPVGSINDPLLLEQLQCHGYGDPCENGTIKLHVRHEDMANSRVILETTYEVDCDNSVYMDDVQDHCYTINFGRSDKINEVPKGKTIIMKVRPANNVELTKVDVKVQKRSKFSDENMKTFISISRRDFQNELSIFFSLQEADELHAIKYSTRIEKHKDDMYTQLNVPCGERRLLFDWSIEELIILTMIFGDMETSWYEQRHGTGLPRQETAKVFDKVKVLDLSCCKFLVNTPDLSHIRNLEELILDHCECLLEISESIGQLKYLILLSMVGCANVSALPCEILQLNLLQLLSLEGCSKIKILPEASMMDVQLESLQRLILDHCTSLTEIPDYVGGLKCLHCLSLKGCSSLKQLPHSIGSLVVLEELILDHCTSLMKIPDDFGGLVKCLRRLSLEHCSSLKWLPPSIMSLVVLEELILDHCNFLVEIPDVVGGLKCLRRLSLQGCSSLLFLPGSIGSSVTTLPVLPTWLGNLRNPWHLKSLPDLSNLIALEELNVENCRSLTKIPGLENLRSLKVLYMNGCSLLNLDIIRWQLKAAAFHDLQAFSIGSVGTVTGAKGGAKTMCLPFPRGGCTRNEPLQLERIDIVVRRKFKHKRKNFEINAAEGNRLCVAVSVGLCLCPTARAQIALTLSEDLKARAPNDDFLLYTATARFGKDDAINKRLRVKATSSGVATLRISCKKPMFLLRRADIWFRS